MNDSTNFSYLEASAKRKKRNQFISILIIIAVVLAVVVGWGIREYNKAQDAERIKNALNSQVEPAFPTASETGNNGSLVDSSAMEIQDSPEVKMSDTTPEEPQPVVEEKPAAPKTVPSEPSPPERKPKAVSSAPAKVEKHETVKPPKADPPVMSVVPPPEKAVVKVEPKPVPKPEVKPEPKVEPKVEEKPIEQVAMVTPEPKVTKTPEPTKAFAPEDLPMPTKVEPTDEGIAAATMVPKVEAAATVVPATGSEHFKTGMEAYKQADYVNAIRAFAALSKPASRKRGEPERDEYVQGNFLRGVALLKMQHISEAASAFQNALEYEKYYPLANMNLGICYIELKQYAKAHKCFEAVIRDQNFLEPSMFDDVMQRTKYFWALAWTRLCKSSKDADRANYYRQQAILRWKDYQVWFGKNDKYKSENQKADNYLKSLSLN